MDWRIFFLNDTLKALKTIFSLLLLASIGVNIQAQGTLEDYKRANAVSAKYSWKMKNGDPTVHVKRGSHQFWYSVWDGTRQVYKEVDADKNEVTLVLKTAGTLGTGVTDGTVEIRDP